MDDWKLIHLLFNAGIPGVGNDKGTVARKPHMPCRKQAPPSSALHRSALELVSPGSSGCDPRFASQNDPM